MTITQQLEKRRWTVDKKIPIAFLLSVSSGLLLQTIILVIVATTWVNELRATQEREAAARRNLESRILAIEQLKLGETLVELRTKLKGQNALLLRIDQRMMSVIEGQRNGR